MFKRCDEPISNLQFLGGGGGEGVTSHWRQREIYREIKNDRLIINDDVWKDLATLVPIGRQNKFFSSRQVDERRV